MGQDGARAQPGLATEAKGKGRMGKGFDMKVPNRLGSRAMKLALGFLQKNIGGNWKFGSGTHSLNGTISGWIPSSNQGRKSHEVPVFSHYIPGFTRRDYIGTYWNYSQ